MAVSTKILEDKLKLYFTEILFLRNEAPSMVDLFSSEVSGDATYDALTNDQAATFSTKLSKQEVQRAKTIADRIDEFFTNQLVSQVNAINHVQGIANGGTEFASPGISPAIEKFGERAVALANKIILIYDLGKDIQDLFIDTGISQAVDGITTGTEIPWYTFSKGDLQDAIDLVKELDNLIDNNPVAQADYGKTVSNWEKIL